MIQRYDLCYFNYRKKLLNFVPRMFDPYDVPDYKALMFLVELKYER